MSYWSKHDDMSPALHSDRRSNRGALEYSLTLAPVRLPLMAMLTPVPGHASPGTHAILWAAMPLKGHVSGTSAVTSNVFIPMVSPNAWRLAVELRSFAPAGCFGGTAGMVD